MEKMHLDLSTLRLRHARLPISTALEYAHRAALGLERAGHTPGCRIELDIEGHVAEGSLSWPERTDLRDLALLDAQRVTEDAAEALGLLVVNEAQRWCVVRRLQRYESADWLLARGAAGGEETLALELSGKAAGDLQPRLRDKLEQVSSCPLGDWKAAVVVGLAAPEVLGRSWETGR